MYILIQCRRCVNHHSILFMIRKMSTCTQYMGFCFKIIAIGCLVECADVGPTETESPQWRPISIGFRGESARAHTVGAWNEWPWPDRDSQGPVGVHLWEQASQDAREREREWPGELRTVEGRKEEPEGKGRGGDPLYMHGHTKLIFRTLRTRCFRPWRRGKEDEGRKMKRRHFPSASFCALASGALHRSVKAATIITKAIAPLQWTHLTLPLSVPGWLAGFPVLGTKP